MVTNSYHGKLIGVFDALTYHVDVIYHVDPNQRKRNDFIHKIECDIIIRLYYYSTFLLWVAIR